MRVRATSVLAVLAGLLMLSGWLAGRVHAAETFTIEEFLQVPTLGSVAVSPDGKQVAWRKTHRDLDEDAYLTELWLGTADGKQARQLTYEDESTGNLAWRPDGTLSFTRTADERAQVFVNPLDGSEPRAVTDFDHDVQAFWWSPDGTWLAVLAEGEKADDDADEDEAAEAADDEDDEDEDRADWIVYDRLEHPDEYPQLWLVPAGQTTVPADDREPRQLSQPPYNVHHVAWSPDGQTLAVTYNPLFSSLIDEEQHVALVDVASGEWTDISDPDRHASFAAFSPDGGRVAFFADREDAFRAYLNLKDLVVRDLATGETTVVTPGHQLALAGTGAIPENPAVWSEDGKTLYLDAGERTTHDIWRVDVKKKTLERVTELVGNVGSWAVSGGTLAYTESQRHLPGSVYTRPVKKDRPRELATVNDAVAAYDLQPAQLLHVPGADGLTIDGFLYLPPGMGDQEKLPAIIEMHGGPYSRYGNEWSSRYPWQVLSHEGFAVFIANPRGGTGYGEQFLRGVYRNFGTDDYRDLMAAVDALVERGTIDPDRLGFTGYSYGGLMTDVVISRTDRFKAAVSIAGIFNYVSAMGQNNSQLFIDSYRQPWAGDLERMWEHSPASRAARITTPTLVMHGLDDEPVDPRQSVELFHYLQLNGVPSRLVLYPDEGHGINRPSHMLDYETREVQWFRHYVLGDGEAAGAEPPVPVEATERPAGAE